MDISREFYESEKCSNCTTFHDTCSNFSSDQEQPPRPTRKKVKEKRNSKELYTHPDYFPVYTSPCTAVNCFYLDLLRHLTMESKIRNNISKTNKTSTHSFLKDCDTQKRFQDEQFYMGKPRTQKLKPFSCKHLKELCSNLCLKCQEKMKCRCCGQYILGNLTPVSPVRKNNSFKHCKCLHGSCPTLLDIHHTLSCCHLHCQKLMHPYYSLHHNARGSSDKVSLNIPVRENSRFYKSSLGSEGYESDSEGQLHENCNSINNVPVKNVATENEPVSQRASKYVKKHDLEDGIIPSFLGGTGDKGLKCQVKCATNTYLPQSTAYFLPLTP